MKRFLKTLGISVCAAAACAAFSISAAAKDINDVCSALREIGIPEYAVQECMNYYYTCRHDENGTYDDKGNYYLYDDLYDAVYDNQEAVKAVIAKQFPAAPAVVTTTTVTTPVPAVSGSEGGEQPAVSTSSTPATPAPTAQKPFSSMTLDEKKAYIGAMNEAERKKFLDSMTVDERNSIIKQMPADDKAEIAQIFIDTMKMMGFSMTVDDISDDKMDISVRNSDGVLIDSSSLGTTVEDTGWDLRLPFAIAASTLLISVGGLVWMAMRTGRQGKKEAANG
ncbi:MAG: hypothetical protein MJ062_07525 [Oscillospiraceae bacterium]|nr:hypothetical protein [Oscillospiraceae bacterium]